ncbi:DNA-binding SARP family transcriptional activator [Streptacidiphilus sp. MAP12-16]|uniref:AfsR/SARP family transcriptional regulator n=1 Tax=Streptacidiphilus sp. MAP12-16 TaxID=3156300 RepID=UPI0035133B64
MADSGQAAEGVQFVVLGPLGFTDGREFAILQPSKPAALLASLLLNANTVVPVSYLQRAIWGDDPPETAKAAVQTCVLRLRRVFGTYGIAASVIESLSDGYRINADARSLDLIRFRELLYRAYAADSPDAELALLRRALALWRSRPILGNVNSALLQRDAVPQLTEEWLQTVERIFDIELALGRCRGVLAEILSMAHSHPVHERFWEQLIEALYRTGRRAEALAEYRRVKQHLLDELGIDPGPPLQRLELAILRGDPLEPGPGAPALRLRPGAAVHAAQPATHTGPSSSGVMVLERLLQAGLLEEGPVGHYQMNERLQEITRAASDEQTAPGVGSALPHRSTGK